MYSINEAAQVIGRSSYVVNDWARRHGIGRETEGTTYCSLYTHAEARKIVESLGRTLSDDVPLAQNNRAILEIPKGKLTSWQIRRMSDADWLPVYQTAREMGFGESQTVKSVELSFTKKDIIDLAKAVGLPNPFNETKETLSQPQITVPAGHYTITQASEILGMQPGRTALMLSRNNAQVRDPTHPKRYLTTKDEIRRVAESEKMPDPFSAEFSKPLDRTGDPWTRLEVGTRRIFVVLAFDARATTDDGEINYSWWIWELDNMAKENCILHGREYRTRDDALAVAAKAFEIPVSRMMKLAVATDRLDPLRSMVWQSGISQNEIAKLARTNARLVWRFARGWNVRAKLESAIVDAMAVAV